MDSTQNKANSPNPCLYFSLCWLTPNHSHTHTHTHPIALLKVPTVTEWLNEDCISFICPSVLFPAQAVFYLDFLYLVETPLVLHFKSLKSVWFQQQETELQCAPLKLLSSLPPLFFFSCKTLFHTDDITLTQFKLKCVIIAINPFRSTVLLDLPLVSERAGSMLHTYS